MHSHDDIHSNNVPVCSGFDKILNKRLLWHGKGTKYVSAVCT